MSTSEILIRNCTRSRIQKIDELRQRGKSWEKVALDAHAHPDTLRRWHRVYERYGIEAFAHD